MHFSAYKNLKAVDDLEKELFQEALTGKKPERERKRTTSNSPPKKKKREPLKPSRPALGKNSNAPSAGSAKSSRVSKENKRPYLIESRREASETQPISSPMRRSSDEVSCFTF